MLVKRYLEKELLGKMDRENCLPTHHTTCISECCRLFASEELHRDRYAFDVYRGGVRGRIKKRQSLSAQSSL